MKFKYWFLELKNIRESLFGLAAFFLILHWGNMLGWGTRPFVGDRALLFPFLATHTIGALLSATMSLPFLAVFRPSFFEGLEARSRMLNALPSSRWAPAFSRYFKITLTQLAFGAVLFVLSRLSGWLSPVPGFVIVEERTWVQFIAAIFLALGLMAIYHLANRLLPRFTYTLKLLFGLSLLFICLVPLRLFYGETGWNAYVGLFAVVSLVFLAIEAWSYRSRPLA